MYIPNIFYILIGTNLALVFKLREICSVDSEENLPPDARFKAKMHQIFRGLLLREGKGG